MLFRSLVRAALSTTTEGDLGASPQVPAPLLAGRITLHGSRGSVEAEPGDRFGWWDGTEWEIVGFMGGRIYSPSGLGGTPIVACKHLSGKLGAAQAQSTDENGLCEWCGDSVASALLRDHRGKAEGPAPTEEQAERSEDAPTYPDKKDGTTDRKSVV